MSQLKVINISKYLIKGGNKNAAHPAPPPYGGR